MDSYSLAPGALEPPANFLTLSKPPKSPSTHPPHLESLVILQRMLQGPWYTQEIITGLKESNSVITATV